MEQVTKIENINDGIEVMYMTPDEWALIPDSPIQRDTERHAKKAVKAHLKSSLLTQNIVNMGILPNGFRCKLDGHTRNMLWQNGTLKKPQRLLVNVLHAKNMEQLKEFYRSYDAQTAAEDLHDQLSGILKNRNIIFSSPLLKALKFATALRSAHNFVYGAQDGAEISLESLVEHWLPELHLLDRTDATHTMFKTGITFGAVLCFARDGADAIEFWTRYANGEGIKIGRDMDAVYRLTSLVEEGRRKKRYGGTALFEMGIASLSAYEAFHRSGDFCSTLRALSIKQQNKWAESVRLAKNVQSRFTLIRNGMYLNAAE